MDISEIARAKACLIAGIMTVGVAGAANFGVAGADADDAIIRVVQWNIGHFAMGRKNRTTIAPDPAQWARKFCVKHPLFCTGMTG